MFTSLRLNGEVAFVIFMSVCVGMCIGLILAGWVGA